MPERLVVTDRPAAESNPTRDRILDAAARRLQNAPLDELTMSGVARTAGVSRQTMYEYFRDRDDLIASVFIAVAEERLVPRRARILDSDLSGDGLERVFWADIEASRAFFDVASDSTVRFGVAEFMLRSTRIREYEETMWLAVLERLAGAGTLAEGLVLSEVAHWLSYQQTCLVALPDGIDEEEAVVRHRIRRFVIDPLLRRT